MISQTTEYALRAVVLLARDQSRAMTVDQIAADTKVPSGYLAKVMQSLGRSGLVRSQRGVGGGFTLARPAEELTLLDVVNAVDPVLRITKCPLEISGHDSRLCGLHARLDEAIAGIERCLGSCTIASLYADQSHPIPLCDPNELLRGD
ncbi:MAG: Rrf2 family transcriptional regulator [Planctomycetota bacterium]|nr:MAG: Rrf2 family transcriptional regulator [Planctomycetota bacterium]